MASAQPIPDDQQDRPREAGESRGLAHRPGYETDKGVRPGDSGVEDALAFHRGAGKLGGATDAVGAGGSDYPDRIAGDIGRIGEEEKGSRGQRRV